MKNAPSPSAPPLANTSPSAPPLANTSPSDLKMVTIEKLHMVRERNYATVRNSSSDSPIYIDLYGNPTEIERHQAIIQRRTRDSSIDKVLINGFSILPDDNGKLKLRFYIYDEDSGASIERRLPQNLLDIFSNLDQKSQLTYPILDMIKCAEKGLVPNTMIEEQALHGYRDPKGCCSIS